MGHFSADDADSDEISFAMGEDIDGTHKLFYNGFNGTLQRCTS